MSSKRSTTQHQADLVVKRHELTVATHERPDEWEEGVNPKPLAGTDSAKLRDEIRALATEPSVRDSAPYASALEAFHGADLDERRFRVGHARDLLEARVGDQRRAAASKLEQAERDAEAALVELQAVAMEIRNVIATMPGLDRGARDLVHPSQQEFDDNPRWPKSRSIEADEGEWSPYVQDLEAASWRRRR